MKKWLGCFTLILLSFVGFAQVKTVSLDYQNNIFNEEQPLPIGTNFVIKGAINNNISVVTMDLFKNHHRKDTLYSTQWRRPIGNASNTFMMPVYYKLRGNDQYDIVFHFYKDLNNSERAQLDTAIRNNLESYIKSSVQISSRRISFRSPINTMLNNMNQIVWNAFTYYKNTLPGSFPGFSDLVKNKLKQLNDLKTKNARYNIKHTSDQEKSQIKQQYGEQLQQQLLSTAMGEVEPYLNGHLAVLEDVRERSHYPTETTRHSLALNVGYGGVYLSGKWGDIDYDSAPYAGISFPLGNNKFSSFWGNTSVSLGVFLKNFKDKDGNEITGPIIGLPYYLGLGYKFLNVLRFQAGFVATSTQKFDNIQNVKTEDIKLKPFVGISAEINLWLGFNKK